MDEDRFIIDKLGDHEARIRKLEENDIQQRIQLTNIEKSQSEIKLMMAEQSREQLKQSKEQIKMLNDFTSNTISYFQNQNMENTKTNNQIKLTDRKEFWGLIALIGGIVATYLGLK